MMNEYGTIALYLLSALLQADAAILGLGIVFIVYRLQHLYNVYQPYVTLLLGSDLSGVPQTCNSIIEGTTEQENEDIRKRYKDHRFLPAFEFIIQSRASLKQIKSQFIPPLLMVASHCILCAVSLWYMSFVCQASSLTFVRYWGGFVVLTFILTLIDVITGAQVAFEVKPIIKGFPLSSRIFKQSDIASTKTGGG